MKISGILIEDKIKEKINYPYVTVLDIPTANNIFWRYNVPKHCRFKMLKEMEQLKLIKFINRKKLEILR